MFLALILAWFIFTILVKLVKTTVSNALKIAAIVVLLQIGFNIGPMDIWNFVTQLPEKLNNIDVQKLR
jgi:hypothetical protein